MMRKLLLSAVLFLSVSAFAQAPHDVSHVEDFQSYGTQNNPPGWVDTSVGSSKPNANGLYKTWPDPLQGNQGTNVVYGTKQSSGKPEGNNPRIGTFSTYTAKSFAGKGRFEYRGRFIRTSTDTRIGFTFFSSYPENDRYYLLGLWSQSDGSLSMQLFSFGAGAGAGSVTGTSDSHVTPAINKWYRFAIQADDVDNATFIRARFWVDGETEPATWSIEAKDSTALRLTSGRIGLWSAVKGDAYIDDITAKSPVDHSAPAIAFVDADTNRTLDPATLALFKVPARIDVRVTDDLSTIATKTIKLDGVDYVPLTPIAVDGTHTIAVHAVDAPGNAADTTLSLLVDTKPPVIALLVNNAPFAGGKVFGVDVTVSASVTDISTTTTAATLDGAAIALPLPVAEERAHTFSVTSQDQVGWTSTASSTFIIDKSDPVITVFANGTELASGAAFQQDVTLTWSVADLTLDSVAATLDGNSIASGAVIASEAIHTLVVTARDRAGHQTSVTRTFPLDKTRPEVRILANGQPFVEGKAFDKPVAFTFDIHNNTPTTTEAKVDGAPYTAGQSVSGEGPHTISVKVTNASGLFTELGPFPFVIDVTKPQVALTESGAPFANGMKFARDVVPVVTASDNLTTSLEKHLFVDGIEYSLGAPIVHESADHTIEATAIDDAGNSATTGVFHFILDKTRPVVTITDGDGKPFAADALFNTPVTIRVKVVDVTKAPPVATLNGAALALTQNGDVWSSAPIAADNVYNISVVATDEVGLSNDPLTASATFRIDTTPPAIEFTSPAANATVSAPTILVQGTSDDAVTIVVNGRDATIDATARTFAIDAVSLLEGRNEITALATDLATNATTSTLVVNLDTRAPELVVTAPAANACFSGTEVQVSGRANDPNLASITVSGVAATRNADGTWNATVPLASEGRVVLDVVAEDASGHRAVMTVPIAVDRTRPAIEITESGAPFTGGFVNRALAPFVRVIDTPSTTVTITLNGNAYAPGTTIATDGAYTLHVTARDCAGNTSDANVEFTIDRAAPHIVSLDPPDGTTIGVKRTITGTLDADDVQSVTIEGTSIAATISGRNFSLDAPLADGVNRFALTVTDRAGNSSTRAYAITLKSSTPSVEILENGSPIPANALYARAATPTIRANESGATISATLDGAAFASGTTIAANGAHTIRATASDAFGHTSPETIATFTIDTTAPTVQITSPANGATLYTATVVVTGTTAGADILTINGVAATMTADAFSATIALEPGANAILAVAYDHAGNSAVAQIEVTRSDDRPGIILTSPANHMLTNRGTTTVAGQLLTIDAGASVTVNGANVPIDAAGSFRVDDFPLHEGDNAITAAIPGTPRAVTVHVNADFTPPSLTVLANGAEMSSGATYETSPAITLNATDANPSVTTSLRIDGTNIAGATPALSNGGHALTAIATDAAGNQVRVDRTFFVGVATAATGCTLTNFDPPDNAAIFASSVRLTGRSGGSANVLVNGARATLDSGSFAISVALPIEGANTITIACADANGAPTNDAPITLTLDRFINAPSITIDALPAILTTTTVTVSGTVGAGVVSGDVNGIAFTPANGTYSVANVSLVKGLNVITARAKNGAGRLGIVTRNVIVANAAPQIAITSPLPSTETGASSIDVSGTYANADPSTIAIGATSVTTRATSDTTGTFVAASVPLAPSGTTTITATARNLAGAQTSASVDVIRISGPSIAIASPLDNAFYPSTTNDLAVSGTIAADDGSTVQVNGAAATVTGTQFTATIPFASAVIARVTSPDGKSASDSIRATRLPVFAIDRTFPDANATAVEPGAAIVILFTNPLDGATAQNAVTLVDDAAHAITGTIFIDNDALSFAPHVPLEAGKRYTLTIAQTLKDLGGSALTAPFTLAFTTATTAPSSPPQVDQSDETGCFSTRTITGTTSVAGARVRLDLDGVPTSTTSGADRRFSFTFSFSGQSGFHIARVREVGVDGTLSPEHAVTYRINCAGPQVVGATLDRAQKKLTIQFSRPMDPSTLTASTIVLRPLGSTTPGGTALIGTIALNAANDTAIVVYSNDLAASLTLTVTKSAKDAAGVPLAADYVQSFLVDTQQQPSGKGYISGAVYDASSGRPLENASVSITPSLATTGDGTLTTDSRGRYVSRPLGEGAYTIEASANGFTKVWRQVVVPAGVGVVPIDIRLTKRGVEQTTGSPLTLRHGGDTAVTKAIEATIPAVAIPSGHTITLTSVGAQSLAGLLPLGWSPLASAEIAIDGSPLPTAIPSTKLTFTGNAADVATQTLSLVQYDHERDEWRTVVAVASINTPIDIDASGNYALVYPDKPALSGAEGGNAPPAARTGAALQGVTNPCAINGSLGVGPAILPDQCKLVSASFTVNPTAVAPSGRTTATLVTIGTGKTYPSGTAVQAYIDEQLNLADGTVRIDPPFATDLLIYRTPTGDAGQAIFHLAPTPQAAAVTLRDGVDHVRIVEYPGRIDRGTLIGAEGGRVPGTDAISIDIPAGATLDSLHASVTPMSAADVTAFGTIAGFRIAGGFTLALTRATDAPPVDLDGDGVADTIPITLLKPARGTFTIDLAKFATSNRQVVIAEVLDTTPFGTMVRLAATTSPSTTTATGVKIFATKDIDRAQLPVDGIVHDGRYLVLTADAPVAFAWGRVRLNSATGLALANARVTSALGVPDLTRAGGTFAIPVPAQPASPFSLRAKSLATGDGAPATFNRAPAADENVPFGDLTLAAQPPTRVTITPDNIEVATDAFQAKATFDVDIDRTSALTALTVVNLTTGTALTGIIDVAGPIVTFTPTTPLAAGARYLITIAPTIRSTTGAPFGRTATAQFTTHALPPNNTTIHPEKIRITIPDEIGKSTISGAAGALPAGAQTIAVRRGRFFIVSYNTTVSADGSFSFNAGHQDLNDRIAITDAIDLQVLDSVSHAIIAVIPLTPFVSADGKSFVAPPDQTVTFTNADGYSVTVPAGAFDEHTVITVGKTEKSATADVPNFDNELAFYGGISVEFAGIAKTRLDVSIPATTALDPSKTYLLGAITDSVRGPRIMIADFLRIDGTKLTTVPSAASNLRSGTNSLTVAPNEVLTGTAARQFLLGVDRPGTYGAVSFYDTIGWAIIESQLTAIDFFFGTSQSVFAPSYYMAERGKILVPIVANKPFTIVGVNVTTGIIDFEKNYEAIVPGDPGVAIVLPSPVDNVIGPYPVFAGPARVELFDCTVIGVDDESRPNIVFTFDGATAKLTNGTTKLPARTRVEMYKVGSNFKASTDDFAALDGGLSLAANKGERVFVLIGAKDVDPNSSINITFSKPIFTNDDDVVFLRKNFKLLVADPAINPRDWKPYSDVLEFEVNSGSRRVALKIPALPRGKLFRFVVSSSVADGPEGGETTLRLGQRLGQSPLAEDLHFDFSTRDSGGIIGTFDIPSGSVRDLAMSGNVLLVSALDAGVFAFDASDPGALASSKPFARIEPPIDQTSASGEVTPGQNWAVATDQHGRVYTTALGSTFGVIRSYRVEDFIAVANTNEPGVVPRKSNAIVSWRPGVNIGLPLSTSSITISDRPEAIPRKMQLVTQEAVYFDQKPFADLRTSFAGTSPVDVGNGFFKSTLTLTGINGGTYLRTRVTVSNVTSELRWSVDIPANGTAQVTVIGREKDIFKVEANARTYAVVSLFGHGVGIYDLNAIESNSIRQGEPGFDPAFVRLKESVIVTEADRGSNCDPNGLVGVCDPASAALNGFSCPIPDLKLSPEAAIVAAGSQLYVYALDQNRGLLELAITPPNLVEGQIEPTSCRRSAGLVLAERVSNPAFSWYGHPRLNELRNRYKQKSGREPIGRYTGIATYKKEQKTYGIIAGYQYGLLVVDLQPNLSYESLVDVIWIPAGAMSVRVLPGHHMATVVDGKGRVLLVDLTHIDEGSKVEPFGTCSVPCVKPLFPTAAAALSSDSTATPGEVGVDDPRIVWKSKYDPNDPTVIGTLAPLVDPDTGFVYTGDVNAKKMRVLAAIDPRMSIVTDLGAVSDIVPLGVKAKIAKATFNGKTASASAFRIELSLPGSVAEKITATNQQLQIAIENETVTGSIAPQTPSGFPKAHLRRSTRTGDPTLRPTTGFNLARVLPTSADPDVQELRYQRGYNHFISPWVVAVADPRASERYQWPAGASKEAEGCFRCDRPDSLRGKNEPEVFELFTNGRVILIRPEVCADGAPGCPKGTSILAPTAAYGYLGADGRLERRIRTYIADTIRAPLVRTAGLNAPVAMGALQETTFVHSGEVMVSAVDLNAGGRAGVDVVIDRSYRSRTIGTSPFGLGWHSSIFDRLRELPNGDVEYRDSGGEIWVFPYVVSSSTYESPRSLFVSLSRSPDGGWLMRDQQSQFAYFDVFGRLTARSDRFATPKDVAIGGDQGNVIRYLYDAQGRLSRMIDPVGRESVVRYWEDGSTDPAAYGGFVREIEDWRGRKVNYEYDVAGRLKTVLLPLIKAAAEVPAEYDFSTSARRPRIRYQYPASAAPTSTTTPQEFTDYIDFAGNLEAVIDPAEAAKGTPTPRVKFTYNTTTDLAQRDRVTKQEWGTGETGTMTYLTPLSAFIVDALGQRTNYELLKTADGRLQVKRIEQAVRTLELPATGDLPTPTVDADVPAASLTTEFEFDTRGEIKRITYPNGGVEEYVNFAPSGTPGTVVATVKEIGGTGLIIQNTHDVRDGTRANLLTVTRSQTGAEGQTVSETRQMHTPSQGRRKTWAFVEDDSNGEIIGQERLYNAQGLVTADRVLDRKPFETDERTVGPVTSERVFVYKPATASNKYERGLLDIESSTSGDLRFKHEYVAANLGGDRTTTVDDIRKVQSELETDAAGRVVRSVVRDAAGAVASDQHLGHDASGRLAYSARKQGDKTVIETLEYDASNRVVKSTLESGAEVMGAPTVIESTTNYDLAQKTITSFAPHEKGQEALAGRTVTTLDGLGRTVGVDRIAPGANGASAQIVRSRAAYDRSGAVAYETDTVRMAVFHRHDSRGRRVASKDRSGLVNEIAWTPWDEVTTEVTKDKNGSEIAFRRYQRIQNGHLRAIYDDAGTSDGTASPIVRWFGWSDGGKQQIVRTGRVPTVFAPPDGTARMSLTTSDGDGRVTATAQGRPNEAGDAFVAGSVYARTSYDGYIGDLPSSITTEEPLAGTSYTTNIAYDALGRATSTRAPGRYTSQTTYDTAGNVTSQTPPGMAPETSTYDGRGLLLTSTTQDGKTVSFAYDTQGALRERTDESGETTKSITDALGRVVAIEYRDGTTEQTQYENLTGAVAAVKNRAGQWRSFRYDAKGDVSEIHNVENPTSSTSLIERHTYDDAARLKMVANGDGAVEYLDYDKLGRPHRTRAYRYKNGTGLAATPEVLDVHTQAHDWNAFSERTRWRMPAVGLEAAAGTSAWYTWIDAEYDAAGNVVALRRADAPLGPTGETFEQAASRSAGCLFSRDQRALKSVFGYHDTAATADDEPSGFLRDVTVLRGSTLVDGTHVKHGESRRIDSIEHRGLNGRTSLFGYTERGWIGSSILAAPSSDAATAAAITETITEAGFRKERKSPLRLTPEQHESLGIARSVEVEVEPWTATEVSVHRLERRQILLDNAVRKTIDFTFAGGRRQSDGVWQMTYDAYNRLVVQESATLGRRISYVYDPNGRMIGRTAQKAATSGWEIESRPEVLASDGLPADTTFVWDPLTDRLAAIYVAGQSTAGDLQPEAGLVRQYIHGDQGYDDPTEVVLDRGARDTGVPSGTVIRYLPSVDAAGTQNITAVFDENGFVVERLLYADTFGDAPHYLQGAVIDEIGMQVEKDPTGVVTSVRIRVRSTDAFDEATLEQGLPLRVINDGGSALATSSTPPELETPSSAVFKLSASEWAAFISASGATQLEIAATNTLRSLPWGPSATFSRIPSWALDLYPGTESTDALPVIKRESLAAIATFIKNSTNTTPGQVFYAIPDLYLAASPESKTKLLTGFKAAPFIEPATGHAYFRHRWYDPSTGTWLTPDPMGYGDSSNLYAFCGNDPINCSDPLGMFGWDPAAWGHSIDRRYTGFKKTDLGELFTLSADVTGSRPDMIVDAATGFLTLYERSGTMIEEEGCHDLHSCGMTISALGGDTGNAILYGTMLHGLAGSAVARLSEALMPSAMFDITLSEREGAALLDELAPRITRGFRSYIGPERQLAAGNPTTRTLGQLRKLRGDARWKAGEEYVRELYGSGPQRHLPVPKVEGSHPIVRGGGRFVDAPVDMPAGGTLSIEVKTYRSSIPLNPGIEQQLHKELWLRRHVANYDPRFLTLDAPPSSELASLLARLRIIAIRYH